MLRSLLAVVMLLYLAGARGQAEHASPDELVKGVIEGVMRSVAPGDSARPLDVAGLTRVVEQKFVPFTDFERTTRSALGDAWKSASAEEKRQLTEQFQKLIVHVYATELTQVSERKVSFRFKPASAGTGAGDVIVHTSMIDNGEDDSIDYRLEKTPAGWRIYDINILGSWLSQLYRNQFAPQLSSGGVAAVIKSLTEHNARLQP